MNKNELDRLETISSQSLYSAGVSAKMVEYSFRVASRFLRGKCVLELGPAEGVMTGLLADTGMELTVVEGSASFCEDLIVRFPGARVVHSLFENFEPDRKFDNIILGHVLEHVEDPIAILKRVKQWLEPYGGCLFAAVPNARSLHRQAAVTMGLLRAEDELNELDIHHGHRRVFNPESFRQIFYRTGMKIDFFGGYWLKPLSNGQIEQSWTPEMLEAFMQLGERYPDIAAEIYVAATL